MPEKAVDIFNSYVRDVKKNKRKYCKFIRQAVARHEDDIKQAKKRGYIFKPALLQPIYDFCLLCKHGKGQWAGKPFVPSPWQVFILGCIFCWVDAKTGKRRFRMAYVEIPRKNGKSFFAAVIALIMFMLDREGGPEIYTAATKRDQARIVFDAAKGIVRMSSEIKEIVAINKYNLSLTHDEAAKFEPLSSDADSMDGLNTHCAVIDELHAHKTRDLWDVIESSTGAREQSLIFAITTAGHNHVGICMEIRKYCANVLDKKSAVLDDRIFAFISTIDESDDWRKPAAWEKANPNYGISVLRDDIAGQCHKAQSVPGAENDFRCKRLDQWVEQAERWLQLDKWDACKGTIDMDKLAGQECYAGLDLASTTDITALVLYFPAPKILLPFFWAPEEAGLTNERANRLAYESWARAGYLTLTPGNVVDYAYIRKTINDLSKIYNILEIAYDKWNATQLAVQLSDTDGFSMVEFGQNFSSMNEPAKEFGRMVLKKEINHGQNPVLRWMAGNIAVDTDSNGNIKPSKKRSGDKIDGIVASIMAIGRAIVTVEDDYDGGITFV